MDRLHKDTEKSAVLGRDDQAGFRLDTTYTDKQHSSLNVANTITTRTDFVNKKCTNLEITRSNDAGAARGSPTPIWPQRSGVCESRWCK